MADTSEPKKKKSQKRIDRQARRAEKRRQKALFEKHEERKQQLKPVKIRTAKKSLPGFLAKNVDNIIQLLKDYQLLYVAADDYGFLNMERFPEARIKHVMQNYVGLVEFITLLEELKTQNSIEKQDADVVSLPEQQTEEIS